MKWFLIYVASSSSSISDRMTVGILTTISRRTFLMDTVLDKTSRWHSVSTHSCSIWMFLCLRKLVSPYILVSKKTSFMNSSFFLHCPVGWDCRIHRLLLCSGVTPNEWPGYDTKQSYGKVPVILELWGMQSTSSWPFFLWSTVARNSSNWYGPIHGLNRTKLQTYTKLNCLKLELFD